MPRSSPRRIALVALAGLVGAVLLTVAAIIWPLLATALGVVLAAAIVRDIRHAAWRHLSIFLVLLLAAGLSLFLAIRGDCEDWCVLAIYSGFAFAVGFQVASRNALYAAAAVSTDRCCGRSCSVGPFSRWASSRSRHAPRAPRSRDCSSPEFTKDPET